MKKILIVDDDRDVFESMKIVLEAEGYGVDWAVNGTEAIDKARSVARQQEEKNKELDDAVKKQ